MVIKRFLSLQQFNIKTLWFPLLESWVKAHRPVGGFQVRVAWGGAVE